MIFHPENMRWVWLVLISYWFNEIRMKLIIGRSETMLLLAEIIEGLLVHSWCLLWELALSLIGSKNAEINLNMW
jgi:hypothetical protein